MFRGRINNERGVSVILVALSIIVLFGFGALSIDVAHIYHVKNQLQVAADAAALAGANELDISTNDPSKQEGARAAAFRLACKNTAGVADSEVAFANVATQGSYRCDYPGCKAGNPLPVGLNTNLQDNTYGDIEVGNYSGGVFKAVDSNTGEILNAVKVTARRGGAGLPAYQPSVSNWFAKVFRLLGARFDFTNISATAVAAKDRLIFSPIVVNEYWQYLKDTSKRPYSDAVHQYPSSFVRMNCVTTINPVTNLPYTQRTSPAFGYTFAILGQNAQNNHGSSDPNGFVELDYRADYYAGGPNNGSPLMIYTAVDSAGDCSTGCNNYFTGPTNTDPPYDNLKTTTGTNYLVNGYPTTRLLPTAIYEILAPFSSTNPTGGSFTNATSVYNTFNQPSNCPHATVNYFSTSGTDPLNFNDNIAGSTKQVADYYPAGTRFMALVYDGNHSESRKFVTIVGYVPIEVDGFSSNNPKTIGLHAGNDAATYAYNKGRLYPSYAVAPGSPNTMYGHALSDIIQPDPSSPKGGCDFMLTLQNAAKKYSTVHLVRYQKILGRYGVANQ